MISKPLIIDNNILDDYSPYTKEIIKKSSADKRDFDDFVSARLSEIIKKNSEYDCIILPFSMDELRYADYSGIHVALHIRLTSEFDHFARLPIIFVGPDANHIDQVARLSKYGGFLFSPYVFWTNAKNSEELQQYLQYVSSLIGDGSEMSDGMYNSFLSCIKIEPSSKYDSRHSIANEWCRFRWMSTIGEKYNTEIKDQLYFKYCERLGRFHKGAESKGIFVFNKVDNTKGLVMLIDDESDKWEPFFKFIFKNAEEKHFVSIGCNFNDYPDKKARVNYIIEEIKRCDPDVVLLDLRLHEEDAKESDKKELSGNIILKKIKNEINKGIQVIAFSASNKDNSYRDFPYDDVIIKESPEDVVDYGDSSKKVDELIGSIKKHLLKANFLKQIILRLNNVDRVVNQQQSFSKTFVDYYKNNKDIAIDFLSRKEENTIYSRYAYLQLFLILEKFLDETTVFDEKDSVYYAILPNGENTEVARYEEINNKKKEYDFHNQIEFRQNEGSYGYFIKEQCDKKNQKSKFLETNFRMSAVLIFSYGNQSSDVCKWPQIVYNRNKKTPAHANGRAPMLKESDFTELVVFMEYVLNRSNCVNTFVEQIRSDTGKIVKEKKTKPEPEFIKTQYYKLEGPKVLDKIDLSQFSKK